MYNNKYDYLFAMYICGKSFFHIAVFCVLDLSQLILILLYIYNLIHLFENSGELKPLKSP